MPHSCRFSYRLLWDFFPGLTLTVAIQGFWRAMRTKQWVLNVLRGVNATAVGLVFTAVYRLWEISTHPASSRVLRAPIRIYHVNSLSLQSIHIYHSKSRTTTLTVFLAFNVSLYYLLYFTECTKWYRNLARTKMSDMIHPQIELWELDTVI
jgi:chromate transport protein ChrA